MNLIRGLSRAECADWCSAHGLVVQRQQEVDFPATRATVSYVYEKIPVARVIALICHLLNDEDAREGWLLWITDYGIWNDQCEELGERWVNSLRRGVGLTAQFPNQPGVILDDIIDVRAMALAISVIGWDAYIIPPHSRYFVFLHHHGVASFVAASRALVERNQSDLSGFEGSIFDAHPLTGPNR